MSYQKRIQSRSRQEVLAGRGTGKLGRQKYLLVDGQEVIEEIWFTPEEYQEAQAKAEEYTDGNLHYCLATAD
jgi:hypothetical protein